MSDVRNNTQRHRFELEIDDEVAKAWYQRQGNVVTFTHTEVPETLAGQGIGSRLAKGALESVRAAGQKVAATCPFIAAYLKSHVGEFDDILAGPPAGPARRPQKHS
jgi:hypothetical protein